MKKFYKVFYKFLLVATIIAVTLFTCLYAGQKTRENSSFPIQSKEHKFILTLWQIDTFEGGVGSRADFLNSLALNFNMDGVIIMVVPMTVESAKLKFEKGEFPDMVSFGIGASFVLKYAKKLKGKGGFGGEINGEIYALPWCRGGYFLISKNVDNQLIEGLIVSKGQFNNPYCALGVQSGDIGVKNLKVKEEEPLRAYTSFLSSKSYLLGTQRDIVRLLKRGVEFNAVPIEDFCDLYQYISVTSSDDKKYFACAQFIEYIRGQEVQKKLQKISMMPVNGENYIQESGLSLYNCKNTIYTVSPFTSAENLNMVDNMAKEGFLKGEDPEKIKKYLIKKS